jgi:hypothetical protein
MSSASEHVGGDEDLVAIEHDADLPAVELAVAAVPACVGATLDGVA